MTAVKICGITTPEDAELCVAAGADAIGLNFHPASPRYIDPAKAREIVAAVGGRTLTVGVFVDATFEQISACKQQSGVKCVQLHGEEPPELLQLLLPHAYKAIRVRDQTSIEQARRFGGQHILLDAYEPGRPGGTGKTFRWELARELAAQRNVTLAGGLDPENVVEAVRSVKPFCVDVASGVESAPGKKDPSKVRAFVAAAKGAC